MPRRHLISFMGCFALPVASLAKRQTVRRHRARKIGVGDTLILYTGLRTPACTKLLDVICMGVDDITIDHDSFTINGVRVAEPERLRYFAQLDGFGNWDELVSFFVGHYKVLPFHGQIIFW